MEPLDANNILEIGRIQGKLIDEPDLLAMFKLLIIIANKRLNSKELDKVILSMALALEENSEPELSDHESDED